MIFPKQIYSFFLVIMLFSCSKNLDFNQVEDYSATPVFTSALAFFTVNNSSFVIVPDTPPVGQIEEITEFRILENTTLQNNLIQLDFNFELANNFNRGFIIEFSLLDDNDNLIYQLEDLNIGANNLNFTQKEEIILAENPLIVNFTKVLIKISLDDTTTPLSNLDNGFLEFKSAITVYLDTSL